MVERLKEAIERARAQREKAEIPGNPRDSLPRSQSLDISDRNKRWLLLPELTLGDADVERHRLVSVNRADPAHLAFDVLRTRLLRVCDEHGWRRIGVTSPTKGCGKSMVALNLAFSIARQADRRLCLIDLDLRAPRIAEYIGTSDSLPLADWLKGRVSFEGHFRRIGENFALGLNTTRVRDSAELLQSESTGVALRDVVARLDPEIILYDLPPLLVSDDVISALPHLDAVIIVAAAGQTKADEITASERLLAGNTVLIGVVLNKSVESARDVYLEGYA